MTINLGTVQIGTVAGQTLTVSNTGNSNMTVAQLTVTDLTSKEARQFSLVDQCSGKNLASGATCSVAVQFKPNAPGVLSVTLNIPSNDPANPVDKVTVLGTGKKR